MILNITGPLLRATDFLIAIAFFILLFSIISYACAKLLNTTTKQVLSEIAYPFLPLLFFIMFYTISFGFLSPVLKLNETTTLTFKYFFLLLGVIWTAHLIKKTTHESSHEKRSKQMYCALLICLTLIWAGLIISDPLHIITQPETTTIFKEGDVIQMYAYSMGFTPEKI